MKKIVRIWSIQVKYTLKHPHPHTHIHERIWIEHKQTSKQTNAREKKHRYEIQLIDTSKTNRTNDWLSETSIVVVRELQLQ